MKNNFLTLILLSVFGSSAFAQGCIQEGEKTVLTGVISKEIFPGPPNYESIKLGDAPEMVYLINIDQERCVTGLYIDSTEAYISDKTSKIQIIFNGIDENPSGMLGKKMQIGGRIYPAENGHHHTPVVLWVEDVNISRDASKVCSLSDVTISSVKAAFKNSCSASECFYMKGVAVLQNSCTEAVGIQVQVTAYDKFGAPVSTIEAWPASTRNIPPGSYTFSLDGYLEYDPTISKFEVKPIDIKRWK